MVVLKRAAAAVLLFVLAAATAVGAKADGRCTIHLLFSRDGTPISGGTVTLYAVSDFVENCGAESADALSRYAKENNLPGDTKPIDSAGTVCYPGLSPGRYLLVQDSAPPGYEPMSPFLADLPMTVGDECLHEVFASPKMAVSVSCDVVTDVPKTGDARYPGLWIMCALLSGLLLFIARKTQK